MQWLINNISPLIVALLALSEAAAALCQIIFPDNKGVSGVLASIIKLLQVLNK